MACLLLLLQYKERGDNRGQVKKKWEEQQEREAWAAPGRRHTVTAHGTWGYGPITPL